MIRSMTGFGKASGELLNKKITIEIKSLNSKQLDLNTRIPNIYREKELEIRNMLLQQIERGKVDLSIHIENVDKVISTQINPVAVENYCQQIKDIAEKLNISYPSNDLFSIILRLPETIKTELAEVKEEEWEIVKNTIDNALIEFIKFREQEGSMLQKLFENKIASIAVLLKEIEKYESERTERTRTKITESLQKIDIVYDTNRLEQELIFYIERLDINEEKNRLDNHLKYFIETMNNENSQGKKLGFIVQEIGREINTLGSKSNHTEMQKIVVQMKDELEQIKEQILNVL